ncbi:unnamed protein product [Arabis nemorensis]|uniref:NADH dehydrogenase [ubiquinone] 1 alpha subcomplex subunit 13 n=1 Tax=Arabis nemorensis TaxID=586526 RepID=A0A565AKP7_9BRAS|nr:unnamed protein product [Arabis nemorensis]
MTEKKPGMVSVKDMPLLQDGPPPGGSSPVRYARRISNTRRSAMAMFLAIAMSGALAWGMYHVGQGNKIRSLLPEAEKKPDPRLIEIINLLKKEDPMNPLPYATLMAVMHKPDEPETDVLLSAMMEVLQNRNESSRPS